jgi:hypothetical protein
MKKIINPQMALFALGVLQPASAREVRGLKKTLFDEAGGLPITKEFSEFLEKQCGAGRVLEVFRNAEPFYSLTAQGSYYLPPKLRRNRDKYRMYLLRDSYRRRFSLSRGGLDEELAGASPAVDTSTDVKGSAAKKLGRTTFGRRFAYGQPYWPRIQGQFVSKTGPTRSPRDTFPNFLSFDTPQQLQDASLVEFRFDYLGLGLCLGVSPQLIWQIAQAPNLHYRTFSIAKKGGGERVIESPRVFLKAIQWFLSDYVLDDLCVHPNVHSFTIGRSIATNAVPHEGKAFVGGVDIQDFFGSISREAVERLLIAHEFENVEANVLARLCTKENRVPQGAPTSPVIANALLYRFDELISAHCAEHDLTYSRYADDISISGSDRAKVERALLLTRDNLLTQYGLQLNPGKTRIVSRLGQQRVTGAIVNQYAAPPRTMRRKIRAAFHEAAKNPADYVNKISQLGGYLGYLKIFPKFSGSELIQKYEGILVQLRNYRRQQA